MYLRSTAFDIGGTRLAAPARSPANFHTSPPAEGGRLRPGMHFARALHPEPSIGGRRAPTIHETAKGGATDERQPSGPAADRALGALDARLVDQGANLVVIEVKLPGELLFRESVNGVWLASTVQVYLDLMRSEGCARKWSSTCARKGSVSGGEARDVLLPLHERLHTGRRDQLDLMAPSLPISRPKWCTLAHASIATTQRPRDDR